jgi:hypothetical protein
MKETQTRERGLGNAASANKDMPSYLDSYTLT